MKHSKQSSPKNGSSDFSALQTVSSLVNRMQHLEDKQTKGCWVE